VNDIVTVYTMQGCMLGCRDYIESSMHRPRVNSLTEKQLTRGPSSADDSLSVWMDNEQTSPDETDDGNKSIVFTTA